MKSKAPLLLMEQMVMLLVFALAAALCVQAFVRSDAASARNEARDEAVVLCQNAAEAIRHSGGNFNEVAKKLGLEFGQGSTMSRYYDENWQPLPISEGPIPGYEGALPDPGRGAAYSLNIHGVLDTPAGVGKASVSVREVDGEVLFEIEVAWQEVFFHG